MGLFVDPVACRCFWFFCLIAWDSWRSGVQGFETCPIGNTQGTIAFLAGTTMLLTAGQACIRTLCVSRTCSNLAQGKCIRQHLPVYTQILGCLFLSFLIHPQLCFSLPQPCPSSASVLPVLLQSLLSVQQLSQEEEHAYLHENHIEVN